jgi:hypothetical protein
MSSFSRADYERYLFTLTDEYSEITASTLRMYTNAFGLS